MKHKIIIIIIAVLFAAGIAGSVWVMNAPPKNCVRVISDGVIVYAADLTLAEDTVFDVTYEDHVNTIQIENHQIRVLRADCPDQTCVSMGRLKSSAMPIVCLPHKLVIEFADSDDGIDAVTR